MVIGRRSTQELDHRGTTEDVQQQFIPYVPSRADSSMAREISLWTHNPNMLPKTQEDILNLFEESRSMVILDASGKIAGHVAFTKTYPDGSLEIGSLVTNPLLLRKGVAGRAIKELFAHGHNLFENFNQRKVFALANEASLPVFLKKDFSLSLDPDSVHPDVWKECIACPVFAARQGKSCCDILVIKDRNSGDISEA